MSIATANWNKYDARKEIKGLIDQVSNNSGFEIDKDFVLKTCLVLLNENIKFQVKNFTQENVCKFEDNWERIKKCIDSAFKLFKHLGFDNRSFRASRAAIPIIYYIYYNGLEKDIYKSTYNKDDQSCIAKWLTLSFMKSMFSGQPDTVIVTMRKAIRANLNKPFPAQAIMDEFKNDPSHNYSLDADYIKEMLHSQKGTNDAFYLLRLLYPHLDYSCEIHQDHLHPKSLFENIEELQKVVPAEDLDFASDPQNWNSVLNLQNLDQFSNTSKQAKPLAKWAEEQKIPNKNLYVKDETSLDIKDFKTFIEDRMATLLVEIQKQL